MEDQELTEDIGNTRREAIRAKARAGMFKNHSISFTLASASFC